MYPSLDGGVHRDPNCIILFILSFFGYYCYYNVLLSAATVKTLQGYTLQFVWLI